ncbi:MAG: hypothetical protein JST22_05535 [Bacteroidetes bacterium]|nr:hypothetical protein [Bacteroidota bacterium]
MPNAPHRIRRQRWVVKVPAEPGAFTVRQSMRHEMQDALHAAIERALDDAGVADEVLHLSHMELRLQLPSVRDLRSDLPDLVYQEMRQQLLTIVERDAAGERQDVVVGRHVLAVSELEVLLHYLRTGMLHWSAAGDSNPGTPARLADICRKELRRLAGMLRAGSAAAGGNVEAFLYRLMQLLSRDDAEEFVRHLLKVERTEPMLAELRGSGSPHSQLEALAAHLAEGLRAGKVQRTRRHSILLTDAQTVFAGLRRLIEGGAPELFQAVIDGIPPEWLERLGSLPDGIEREALNRDDRIRFVAGLLARWIADVNAWPGVIAAAEAMWRMLAELAPDDASRLRDAMMGETAAPLRGTVERLVAAMESARELLGDDVVLRTAAGVIVAAVHSAGGPATPNAGPIVRALLDARGRGTLARWLRQEPGLTPSKLGLEHVENAQGGADGNPDVVPAGDESDRVADRQRNRRPAWFDDDPSVRSRETPDEERIGAGAAGDDRYNDAGGADYPLVVQHAGLVLLHPFLPSFFRNLGLIGAGEKVIPAEQAPRAAALLHLLATGRDDAFEFEISFGKVLLGLAPETPMPISAGLVQPEDIEEAEALLGSVIEHWSILKGTSIASLRTSFLQRSGLLRRERERLCVHVEPAYFDMLLNQLPWGISIIVLPWMAAPVFVEWESP